MVETPEDKRLARLRPWSNEALQEAKERALRRVKDIETVQAQKREERDGQEASR